METTKTRRQVCPVFACKSLPASAKKYLFALPGKRMKDAPQVLYAPHFFFSLAFFAGSASAILNSMFALQ
ncbi:hypothetical protein [Labrenzia sp. CE80]|uniref:hypothetical protein n=1 Tax=Labrenzia sp. CE80 TaxID=1788986 RepID=UPI00129A2944|nr:hypothetical protein [Labrenzia sp. CE80]